MRELNEQELEQVAGGFGGYYAGGVAEAGSLVSIKKGMVGSVSDASVLVTPKLVVAGASNMTIATGKFLGGVASGAKVSGEVLS